jgi:5-methylcytosine-specific restriction endonuclease McrA
MLQVPATVVSAFQELSNQELLDETRRLAEDQRRATARLVAAIAEVDARRLYLSEGCSSIVVYCVRVLCLSEHAAYLRIEVARLSRRFPEILNRLADGSLTLTNICLLAPYLTPENCEQLIKEAMHRTKRELEEFLAARFPHIEPARRAGLLVQPLAADRFRVEFTVTRETLDKLRRAQDLLRHSVPDGDPAVVLDKALDLLLTSVEKKKIGNCRRPKATGVAPSHSRHIPASVRRTVWRRDNGRCAFVGTQGQCGETRFLEFHHVKPFAAGGETTAENLQLRCRAHNAYEAEVFFGPAKSWHEAETATEVVESRSGPSSIDSAATAVPLGSIGAPRPAT